MQRLLIFGANSALGTYFHSESFPGWEIVRTSRKDGPGVFALDIGVEQDVQHALREFKPTATMNLAAITDLEFCEKNVSTAYQTNSFAAENCAAYSREVGAKHVYISTASVFDGEGDVPHEFAPTNPLSIYSKSKLAGETLVQRVCPESFVFRAAWLIGGGKKSSKFVSKVFGQIQDGRKELQAVDDVQGSITFCKDLATVIARALQTPFFGAYNAVNQGVATRYSILTEMLKILELEKQITVQAVSAKTFDHLYSAPRPKRETLNPFHCDARFGAMPDWRDSLKEYLLKDLKPGWTK